MTVFFPPTSKTETWHSSTTKMPCCVSKDICDEFSPPVYQVTDRQNLELAGGPAEACDQF